jgi:HAD superfamily hydrolase (TIGR01509 family)
MLSFLRYNRQSVRMSRQAIFFDAGNTLVFPDRSRTLAPLLARGIEPSQEQLWAAERVARKRRDAAATTGDPRQVDNEYWAIYYGELFRQIAASGAQTRDLASLQNDPELLGELVRCARKAGNWDVVREGTREILLELKRTYRLAVISNSDGHMAELIARVGLGDCFESVTDSTVVGVEKPNPRIFQLAAEAMQVSPADCLYVGDVYSIDYLGARNAGFDAVLFDVCGAYRDENLPRVQSLEELQKRLSADLHGSRGLTRKEKE